MTESPKGRGEGLNVTCLYRLGERLFETLAKK